MSICADVHPGRACPLSGKCAPRRKKPSPELLKLRGQVVEMHDKMATRGWKFTAWRCGKCKCLNIHNCPKPEDTAGDRKYWDSTMICVWCNNCSFVAIWPSGRCRAKLLGGDGEIIETNAKPATLKTLRSRIEADYV